MFLYIVSLDNNKAIVGVADSPATEVKMLPSMSDWVVKYPARELLAIQSVAPPYESAVNRAVVNLVREQCDIEYARGTMGAYTAVELPAKTQTHLRQLLLNDCVAVEENVRETANVVAMAAIESDEEPEFTYEISSADEESN